MATFNSILSLVGGAGNFVTAAESSATAAILVGAVIGQGALSGSVQRAIFAINATEDITIRMGNSSVAAVSTDFRLPANGTYTFDTGNEQAYMSLYNLGTETVNITWAYLSKF